MKIYLVTKNSGKLAAANSIFSKYNIELNLVKNDYPEIQAENSLEIARFTALEAAKSLNAPAIREDHSLYINALKFPGPYTNYFEKKISPAMLLEWLKNYNDRDGYFEIATVYAEPNGFIKEFIYQVPITVALEERGSLQEGWAKILMLKNDTRTFAEYPEQERLSVWNKNYQAIGAYVNKKI
ncbi:MAG: non-canonical purine NTP pyrophosphatase [bacterium]|nr:non-canonical purine NTP pyrophosphatase [bacterium]